MKGIFYLISIVVLTVFAIDINIRREANTESRERELFALSIECAEKVNDLKIVDVVASEENSEFKLVSYLSEDLTPCMTDSHFTQKVLMLDQDNQHTNPEESNALVVPFESDNWGY